MIAVLVVGFPLGARLCHQLPRPRLAVRLTSAVPRSRETRARTWIVVNSSSDWCFGRRRTNASSVWPPGWQSGRCLELDKRFHAHCLCQRRQASTHELGYRAGLVRLILSHLLLIELFRKFNSSFALLPLTARALTDPASKLDVRSRGRLCADFRE